MKNWFLPTQKNNFRAHLIKPRALVLFAIIIFLVNSILPASTFFAQNVDISVDKLLEYHNIERVSQNLPQLNLSQKLKQSAQAKAEAMLVSNCWSHYCPEGKSPWDFFLDAGFDYEYAGENLAEGFVSVERVILAWMTSQSHRANILKPEFREVGFGIAQGDFQGKPGNIIIVVHFGSPMDISVEGLSNPSINLFEPKQGEIYTDDSVLVSGQAQDINEIRVVLNELEEGKIIVDGGLFTKRVTNVANGSNILILVGDEIVTSEVEFFYEPNVVVQSGIGFGDMSASNVINLVFISILALLFFFDFVYITRTKVLDHKLAFSHYHFAILLVLALVLFTGSTSGQINLALFT